MWITLLPQNCLQLESFITFVNKYTIRKVNIKQIFVKMSNKIKKESQKDRIARQLYEISKDVTEDDRKEYLKLGKGSVTTLSLYMNRKVANSDLALEMLEFFQKRIEEREKVLARLTKKTA